MLPLLITFLLAVYVLGPDLIARWIIGLSVPRRAVVQSRSEEWSRSIVWCSIPLILAWVWAHSAGAMARYGGRATVETVFSGLYDEPYFLANRDAFFAAVRAFWWMNLQLMWRLYGIVAVVALGLIGLIQRYGQIRGRLEKHPFWKGALAVVVLPRVSDWHVMLSRMLLPSKEFEVFLDVLTKSDTLYQGRLADKTLGPDGSLIKITLAEPSKFRRQRYLTAVEKDPSVLMTDYWNTIPGENFVLMASEIASLNVRHVRPKITTEEEPDVIAALKSVVARLERPRASDSSSRLDAKSAL